MTHRWSLRAGSSVLTGALVSGLAMVPLACGGSSASQQRTVGQSDFASVAPGSGQAVGHGANDAAAGPQAAGGATAAVPGTSSSTSSTRTVEETDLYRLEGDRLYYLNAYRGLMVFDVSDVDAPKLLGRSPIYGSPVAMPSLTIISTGEP